jgi:hypothetical protein
LGEIEYRKVEYIPVKFGLALNSKKGFYIEPQLGFATDGSEIGSVYGLQAGYSLKRKIDISGRYESWDDEGMGSKRHIGFRIAYAF